MEHILQSIIIVIPIIFVLAFGFFAGRKKAFGQEGNPLNILNELVLTFALPPALFVGTVTVSRSHLIHELDLFFALLVTLSIAYLIGLGLAKYIFKRNMVESSIAGLAVSFSAGPFYGPALLGSLYGIESGVAVSMISVVINVVIVPLATIIIKMDLAQHAETKSSVLHLITTSLYQAVFKTPFVWAPLVAFILVFLNIQMPHVVINSLELIGKATAGVAVFVAGMTIAANSFKIDAEVLVISLLKNIAMPLLFIVVAIGLFHMPQHTSTFNEGLLLAALPSGPMIVLLATRYQQYQQQASTILAVTTIGMLLTVTALIVMIGG
ncbi:MULTISPECIES: AEC family transporter [unclassified Acinetobacter]|uniref:AEC family transporter n=1 Tax=unclassified Acinetobacter TaxID=196816 RepID=UPI00293514D8|nr:MULTISPECIES: AEC family transporter [unclassified Acinetobacter]WOE31743.1 AEC family transporter [Acinetobacter sp. SAAs470]WOE37210.1 AEC family transporter [Acinetobacter sp. SAAs474]